MADVEALEIQPLLPTMENMGLIQHDANALLAMEPPKPQFLQVIGPDGEDLTTYFDKTFVGVERILSTT